MDEYGARGFLLQNLDPKFYQDLQRSVTESKPYDNLFNIPGIIDDNLRIEVVEVFPLTHKEVIFFEKFFGFPYLDSYPKNMLKLVYESVYKKDDLLFRVIKFY